MCTEISIATPMEGSGKSGAGWFPVSLAYVSYDHPFNLPQEHSLNIDFVNPDVGPGARVAVELTRESARQLVSAILSALEQGEAVSESPMFEPGKRWMPPKRFQSTAGR